MARPRTNTTWIFNYASNIIGGVVGGTVVALAFYLDGKTTYLCQLSIVLLVAVILTIGGFNILKAIRCSDC